jgi:fluoride exporter
MSRILIFVALGGGCGALVRFGLSGWVTTWAGAGFPWGTFAVNAIGSSLLGLALGGFTRVSLPVEMRALVTAGFCGGLTTFSTFDYESLVLLASREFALAAAYALGSVLACLGGAAAGFLAVAKRAGPMVPESTRRS